MRKNAARTGKRLIQREGDRNIGRDFRDAAGVLIDLGKSALAELSHRQAQASEYVFHDDRFEVITPSRITSVRYDQVKQIKLQKDALKIVLDAGQVSVRPHAYIVSGRIKVPVGWQRNGLEVPYETLLEELSGRSGVNIEHL